MKKGFWLIFSVLFLALGITFFTPTITGNVVGVSKPVSNTFGFVLLIAGMMLLGGWFGKSSNNDLEKNVDNSPRVNEDKGFEVKTDKGPELKKGVDFEAKAEMHRESARNFREEGKHNQADIHFKKAMDAYSSADKGSYVQDTKKEMQRKPSVNPQYEKGNSPNENIPEKLSSDESKNPGEEY